MRRWSAVKAVVVGVIMVGIFVGAVMLGGGHGGGGKLKIVATSFPGYDLVRAAVGEDGETEVKMLLKPGAELHDYEPTPQDIKNMEESDLLVYVGGESDEWVDGVLKNLSKDEVEVVRLMDLVKPVEEELVEGMEHEDEEGEKAEYDEHIWTSPVNAAILVRGVGEKVAELAPEKAEIYKGNAEEYAEELTRVDAEIREVVDGAKRKEMIFGDRFPLRYFADEYGLRYYAAFPGCAEQTEVSARTLAFLVDKVKADGVPVVFKIELSDGKIAEQIAEATGVRVLEFQSGHNVSREDYEAGVTLAELMRGNIVALKEALN